MRDILALLRRLKIGLRLRWLGEKGSMILAVGYSVISCLHLDSALYLSRQLSIATVLVL